LTISSHDPKIVWYVSGGRGGGYAALLKITKIIGFGSWQQLGHFLFTTIMSTLASGHTASSQMDIEDQVAVK
jgi:hypothetical protein